MTGGDSHGTRTDRGEATAACVGCRKPWGLCECEPRPAGKQAWIDGHMARAHELAVNAAFGRELIEQADKRVFTNDLDALEHLILQGELPLDEMQAAAWLLVQRVRGLREDLMRFQGALVRSRGMKEYVEESRTHGR